MLPIPAPPVPHTAAPVPTKPRVWAFCGVHPDDPSAATAVVFLHAAGVDATLGPCMPPPVGYTAANTGTRYLDPLGYLHLVDVNAAAGLKTVVYDARVWSDDPALRQNARDYWASRASDIAAWDMGDEFNSTSPEWQVLVHRWNIVLATDTLGIKPFTNMVPGADFALALTDLQGWTDTASFDSYGREVEYATKWSPYVTDLMCAINALDSAPFHPSYDLIKQTMLDTKAAGCDSFLIFGGHIPYDTAGFTGSSLVDSMGNLTPWGAAVHDALF